MTVGLDELPELIRRSDEFATAWEKRGLPVRYVPLAGHDHLASHVGGPEMAPHTPQRSQRPGEAVTAPLTRQPVEDSRVLVARIRV